MDANQISHILIQEDEIRQRIEELGAAITEDYADKGEIVSDLCAERRDGLYE